ncbi:MULTISPECIES: hypothetical protein [unclassified Bradyrhizobium]|uniref:hypothetical protein n=1 Tax=unclassified Bradyrhizobium TaxID=2631580 RepID=UPI0028E277EA|nr:MULTISPECIES: hypothetical protein [unclassified Bradyrhizobium]
MRSHVISVGCYFLAAFCVPAAAYVQTIPSRPQPPIHQTHQTVGKIKGVGSIVGSTVNWFGKRAVMQQAWSDAYDKAREVADQEGPGKTVIIMIDVYQKPTHPDAVEQPLDALVYRWGVGNNYEEARRNGADVVSISPRAPDGSSPLGSQVIVFQTSDLLSQPSRSDQPTALERTPPQGVQRNMPPSNQEREFRVGPFSHEQIRQGIERSNEIDRAEVKERTALADCYAQPSDCYTLVSESSSGPIRTLFAVQKRDHHPIRSRLLKRIVGYLTVAQ